jgi:cation diffusion facilitator CzcD-associated flavoprotein CzcO
VSIDASVHGQPHKVVIIGAGFGGLGMAIELRRAGIEDFVVLERNDAIGGVWHDNLYPGAACDVPSHLYSYSFEPKPDWSRKFAAQNEILTYLQHCVRKYDLQRHLRLSTEVQSAQFDEAAGLWEVRIKSGETLRAHALVCACGQLNRPAYPSLPGLERFKGTAFHSARWKQDYDLRGKRVAIIGTGASAIQIVPSIIDTVKSLQLFQRHAAYVIPKPDREYAAWEKALYAAVPVTQKLSRGRLYSTHETRVLGFTYFPKLMKIVERAFTREITRVVKDPELRRKLTPDYPIGCKRILISNDFYPALCKPNAELVTDAIERIEERGIVTADGKLREVDAIIYGTGFTASDFLAPMEIRGRAGKDLNEEWRDGAQAYLGINISGFPNLFMLYGPNTSLGHSSIVYMLESQIHYVMACLRELDTRKLRFLDVLARVQSEFNDSLQAQLKRTVWDQGCDSWYKLSSGKHTNNWPGFTFAYRRLTRTPDFSRYELV